MRNLLILVSMVCALTSFVGCASYEIVNTNVFSDEDGNVIFIGYGRGEEEHVNYFRSPANGKKMEFKSRLMIEVALPDGRSTVAWQCMNFLQAGTMYQSENEHWKILVNGFACVVYELEDDTERYREVYRGVLCESPKTEFKTNSKWRNLKKNDRGVWK